MHLKISRNLYALFGSNLIIHFRQEFVETFRFEVSNLVNKIKGVIRDFSSHALSKIAAAFDEPSSQHAISLRCHSITCVLSIFPLIYLMSLKNENGQM